MTEPIKETKEKWKLLPAFLKTKGLVKQHIDSFNHFLRVDIHKILEANKLVRSSKDPNFFLEYKKIWVGDPEIEHDLISTKITPHECRLRDLTYSAPVYVNIEYTRGKEHVIQDYPELIGRLPIMLRSAKCVLTGKSEEELAHKYKECPLDPGGYFVVKGNEKVVLSHEQLQKNRIIVEVDNKKNLSASVTSSTTERKSKTTIIYTKGKFYLHNNTFTADLPIVIVLKGMGVESDQEIIQLVGSEPLYSTCMAASIEECTNQKIFTQEQALKWLGTKVKPFYRTRIRAMSEEARDILAEVVLTHIPVLYYNFHLKVIYVAHMLRRIIKATVDKEAIDDKDYYGNKRIELAGQLISLLFEDSFKQLNANLQKIAENALSKPHLATEFDMGKQIASVRDIMHKSIERALATGNWKLKRFKMDRVGVTQILSRLSFISSVGMMTRIQSQFEKSRKVSGPRALQPSQWGVLCPSDTPEGESCGLVKNLALLTHVTTDQDEEVVKKMAYNLGVEDVTILSGEEVNSPTTFLVFLNGVLIGVQTQPATFIRSFRMLRRAGQISEFVSIYCHRGHQTIDISTDGGRLCRPLIIVENGKSKVQDHHIQELSDGLRSFDDFLKEGLIEYIDVNEENNCRIAMYDREIIRATTHVEINPLTILGCVAGLIPYPHHNQSPRNTYQCAMGKQAMGNIGYNQYNRIDTLLLLVYPQRPLCKTKQIELIGFNKLGAGQNAMVAVMSYSGYDIEDAVVMNRASIDRGFGRCMVLKKDKCTLRKYANMTEDHLFKPDVANNQIAAKMYAKVDPDGLPSPNSIIDSGEVYMIKTVPAITEDMANLTASKAPPKLGFFHLL
uniref:DNA-directed RNA polymerase n=1 Tax=Arcella intermedia TaxID=1963864 RepID=A0A6B2KXR4_9EUKA